MQKITIAFVIDTIKIPLGGTENQLLNLIQNLNKNKFRVFFCYLEESNWIKENIAKEMTFNIGSLNYKHPNLIKRIIRFSRFLKKNKINILQSFFRDSNFVATVSGKIAKTPIIISSRRNKGHWHNKTELILLRFLNPMTTRILTNSYDIKQYSHQHEKISNKKIDVIYNGYDNAFFGDNKKLEQDIRSCCNFNTESITAVCISNLKPVKNLEFLIETTKLIVDKHPEFQLLIIGEGIEREKLIKLCETCKLKKNISFLGFRKDIPALLKLTNIGILASKSEGLSNTIIEYMVSGLPVVATDVGGNKELIEHKVNGYLVPLNDCIKMSNYIIELLNNPELREKMGGKSKKIAITKFSLKKYVSEHEKYYKNLIDLSNK